VPFFVLNSKTHPPFSFPFSPSLCDSTMSSRRQTPRPQKVEMKKISKESNLRVSFSRRRSGLFKKASELCTLSGAEVALVVFSPSEKVFSFGHPNVDTIIDRYLSQVPHQNNGIT
jgi:hypothetical protein